MLPEQRDILWSFLTLAFTVFALYVFINAVRHCREREDVNGKFWGSIFGGFLVVMFLEAIHMFSLNQAEQMCSFLAEWF